MTDSNTTTSSSGDGGSTATTKGDESGQIQLVTFEVGSEEFGVDILSVHEINRMMEITQVPESADCVEGVVNLRGRIIPVLDLRKRFGMPAVERTVHHRIIVVEVEGRTIGFVVDRVHEVLRIDASIVEEAPDVVKSNVDGAYIDGVGMLEERLLILLNLNRLFDFSSLDAAESTVREAA
ncbi:MAG: chemotaxis protein CheW [Planctomycetota bacterium]